MWAVNVNQNNELKDATWSWGELQRWVILLSATHFTMHMVIFSVFNMRILNSAALTERFESFRHTQPARAAAFKKTQSFKCWICAEIYQSPQLLVANIEASHYTEPFLLMNETSLFDVSLVSRSYHVSASAGCHLVCSPSPWGLFRLKRPTEEGIMHPDWTHELAKVGLVALLHQSRHFLPRSEPAAEFEKEKSFSTPYLEWHMCASHFPISMNLIWGAYANKMSALQVRVEYGTVMEFQLLSPTVLNSSNTKAVFFCSFHNLHSPKED